MAVPIVYDVLIRQQVEANNPAEAIQFIAEELKEKVTGGLHFGFEVIRDDNKFPPKDYSSRETNGFAVFTSEQKHELLAKLEGALEAAGKGNPAPGEALLNTLHRKFDYLANSTLVGVEV